MDNSGKSDEEKEPIYCPNCDCEVKVTSNENKENFCYCIKEDKTYKVKFCANSHCYTLLHEDAEPVCCVLHDPGAWL